jgi:hypothetical protein
MVYQIFVVIRSYQKAYLLNKKKCNKILTVTWTFSWTERTMRLLGERSLRKIKNR